MATIIKRKKKCSVVYYYEDENGEQKQKWETYNTPAEAKKRKVEIESEQINGTFIPPKDIIVKDFLYDFIKIYGSAHWALSTYESNCALIANYINPIIVDFVINNIHKVLRCAFDQAVKWEMISRNPFPMANRPKTNYKKREIWDAEMIRTALDGCKEPKLYIAMNLAFACSLRLGEIIGLQWDNVHISDADIAADDAHVISEMLSRTDL